jgi:hypothetical protein
MSAQIKDFKQRAETKTAKVVDLELYREIAKAKVAEVVPADRWVIHDDAKITCEFNVMQDRPVKENFYIKEYRIDNSYGEATFDRDYFSSMEKSPDHMIFLTAQVHTQKLLYLVLSKYFGFEYSANSKENLKIWPTQVSVDMPKMVRDNENVVQKLWVHSVEAVRENVFKVQITSTFNGIVKITSETHVYLISETKSV